jgi:hypothetical protein
MLYSPEVHICVIPLFNVVSLRYDLNAMIPFQLLRAKVSAFFVGIVSYVIKELFTV